MSKKDLWELFKDKFTDLLGLAIMLATASGVWWTGTISLLYDGVVGLLVGFIFLMIPDGTIVSFIKAWAKKKFGDDSDS